FWRWRPGGQGATCRSWQALLRLPRPPHGGSTWPVPWWAVGPSEATLTAEGRAGVRWGGVAGALGGGGRHREAGGQGRARPEGARQARGGRGPAREQGDGRGAGPPQGPHQPPDAVPGRDQGE